MGDSLRRRGPPLTLAALVLALQASAAVSTTNNFRASVSSSGAQANERSIMLGLSGNGQFALFSSAATNLVPADTNARTDLFVRDLTAGTTVRVSLTSSGGQIENSVTDTAGSISANGRRIAFDTDSTNLVLADGDRDLDVFVRDLDSGMTTLASVAPDGRPGSWWNEGAGRWEPATSNWPGLSSDGRYVAFTSSASNLLSSDVDNQLYAFQQMYLRDLASGQTSLISVGLSGEPATCLCGPNLNFSAPALSADGRFVAFQSNAVNLVAGDTNGSADVFVRDRVTGTTERVNRSSSGAQANGQDVGEQPAMSPDGRFIAFTSTATNLVEGDTNNSSDVFLHDRLNGRTERVSLTDRGRQSSGNGSYAPSLSSDGRFISFTSNSNDLVENDSWPFNDVFIRDRVTGNTTRVTIPTGGGTPARGEGRSGAHALSADGRYVGITSEAPLGPGDTNEARDAYVHDRQIAAAPTPAKGGAPVTISVAKRGSQAFIRGSSMSCCGIRMTGTVAVRLFVYRKTMRKFAVIARKVARLDDGARYRVAFRRPKGRRCKVSAHFVDTAFFAGGTTIKNFRC